MTAEFRRVDGPEVSTEFGEEAVDGGEWRCRVGRGGASLGGGRTARRNRDGEDGVGSAMRSRRVSPENLCAAANGGAESSSGKGRRKLEGRWSESMGDEEPSHPYMEKEIVGRKRPGPHRFTSWAATWRQSTRVAGGYHTGGHTDPLRHINCARELKDWTSDTGAPGTVRMSRTTQTSGYSRPRRGEP
jgi:hypothetical protein